MSLKNRLQKLEASMPKKKEIECDLSNLTYEELTELEKVYDGEIDKCDPHIQAILEKVVWK